MRRIAPCWFAAEVAGALYRRLLRGDIRPDEVHAMLSGILSAVRLRSETAAIATRAIDVAAILQQGRPYDAMYLALAEQAGCELWTGDERFFNAACSHFPFVRFVGYYVVR